jgi:hypothetical protein
MDFPAERPPSRYEQARGPLVGIFGFLFFVVGLVCVGLTSQSPALFWVGRGFIVVAFLIFCALCGSCAYAYRYGNTYHFHSYQNGDSKQLLQPSDVPSRPSIPSVRNSKMELW